MKGCFALAKFELALIGGVAVGLASYLPAMLPTSATVDR
jgi:hypothetical protein